MPQLQKIGKHATTVSMIDGMTLVTYHNTVVVRVVSSGIREGIKGTVDYIVLDSGGYQTATTKTRMNQAANEFGLSFKVYQKNHVWYVDTRGQTHEFYDGMRIDTRTGKLL